MAEKDVDGSPAGETQDSENRSPLLPWAPLEVVALSAFAISQPIYSLIGDNATFLVANRVTGSGIIWFAVAVLAIPALVLAGLDLVIVTAGRRWASLGHATLLGTLFALAIGTPVMRTAGLEGPLYLAGLLATAAGATYALLRWSRLREVARWALFAPLLFMAMFLLSGPISGLRAPQDSSESVIASGNALEDTSVVMLVFDQLPLTMLLEPDGSLDGARFPGFERLAQVSTFYPDARALAPRTNLSVPSILSGSIPDPGTLPVYSEYPNNLFTALARSHDIYADEYVTQLCPDSVCSDGGSGSSSIWTDTAIVAARLLLDDRTADSLLPEIDGRWNNFTASVSDEATNSDELMEQRRATEDDRVRFEDFLEELGSVGTPDRPDVNYLHLFQPHEPLRYLPDGRTHNPGGPYEISDDGVWSDNEQMVEARLQQYLAQAMWADLQVSATLDRLEQLGTMDDTLLVVTSDHGAGLGPGMPNKNMELDSTPTELTEMLSIPLFIHFPGGEARTSTVPVQTQDVLPTLLDAMGAADGLDFDGEPAGEIAPTRPYQIITSDGAERSPAFAAPPSSPVKARIRETMPIPGDPFAFGPAVDLMGERPEAPFAPAVLTAELDDGEEFSDISTTADHLPVTINARVEGSSKSSHLLVMLNGVVAGGGTTWRSSADEWRLTTLVDPGLLRDGPNTVELLEATDGGLREVEVVSS